MEAALPAHICTDLSSDQTDMLITAYAPGQATLPDTLQGQGSIYLLAPICPDNDVPDLADLCSMCDYLAHMIASGKVKSARAFGGKTPAAVLDEMSDGSCKVLCNPAHTDKMDRIFPLAIMVETAQEMEGDLIAASLLKVAPKQGLTD
jgi:hypothetical protein